MGAIAGGGGYTKAETDFARALSLVMRDRPIAYRQVHDLARQVLGAGMALDAAPARPGRVLEDAMAELSAHLSKVIRDPDDLHRALELSNSVANAAQRDAELEKADAADGRRGRDAEAEQRGAADRRRQAADARPSVLDSVLRGVRKPMRL